MNRSGKDSTKWYQKSFGQDYLRVYQHRNAALAKKEVAFITKALSLKKEWRILDMCCGAGRHMRLLLDEGYQVIGGDLSKILLCAYITDVQEKPPILQYDMQALPFSTNCFDAVLSLFTSFGYFESDLENEAVLTNVANVLKEGGLFFFDYLNAPQAIASLIPESEKEIAGEPIYEKRYYDSANKRIIKTIEVGQGEDKRQYLESVRAYTLDELKPMFLSAKLKIREIFGDFNGNDYNEGSERLIIIAKKGECYNVSCRP